MTHVTWGDRQHEPFTQQLLKRRGPKSMIVNDSWMYITCECIYIHIYMLSLYIIKFPKILKQHGKTWAKYVMYHTLSVHSKTLELSTFNTFQNCAQNYVGFCRKIGHDIWWLFIVVLGKTKAIGRGGRGISPVITSNQGYIYLTHV